MRCRWGFGLWIDTVMGWDFLGNVGMWWVYFACGKDMKLWNQRVGFISSPLEPMSCYLLWIKMLKMWIGYGSWDGGFFFFLWSQWTLNAITRVLSEWDERRSDRRGEGSVTTEVEIGVIQPCDHRGRDWSDSATNQWKAAVTREWRAFSSQPPEGGQPGWRFDFGPVIPSLDFLPPELWRDKVLLSQVTCGVIFGSICRKLI